MAKTDSSKTDLAEERTDLAEDRTVMANERTFAGWLRTGLASIGIGLGFNAIFGKLDPNWFPKLIATGFMLIGILIILSAYRRAASLFDRLNCHKVAAPSRQNMRLVAGLMTLGAMALIGAIWHFDWTV